MNGYTSGGDPRRRLRRCSTRRRARFRDEPMAHLRAAAKRGAFAERASAGGRTARSSSPTSSSRRCTRTQADRVLEGRAGPERAELAPPGARPPSHRRRAPAERGRFRERFVASLSHDLRSPLSAAKTAAQVIALGSLPAAKIVDLVATDLGQHRPRRPHARRSPRREPHRRGPAVEARARGVRPGRDRAQGLLAELASRHGPRFHVVTEGPTKGVWNAEALRRVLDNLSRMP